MRYRRTFEVPGPPERAFDYIADGMHTLAAQPAGTRMEQVPPDRIDFGTTFVVTRPDLPVSRSRIVEYDRPARLVFETAFEGNEPSRAAWTFAANATGGTRLTVETTSTSMAPWWIRPFMGLLTVAAWPFLTYKVRVEEDRIRRELARLEASGDP